MPTRSLVKAVCAAALGWGAVVFADDTAVQSVVSPQCADGSCVPRRLTNGYYPTTWRRWPVDPPARGKSGVREGISAQNLELPAPRMETYLPEGVLMAPPLDQGGGDGGFESGPRESIPGALPPGPAAPRGGLPEGLPPDLRSEPTRAPSQQHLPRRPRAIAGREVNRPAAVIEALRNEAAANPSAAIWRGSPANIPAALPKDEGQAQPLSPPAGQETSSARPTMGSAPTLNSLHLNHDQAYRGDQTSGKGRTNWSPTRESQENAAQPTSADSQPEAGGLFNSPEQAASRQVTSSLNAPAAIYARTLASDSNRPAIRADFTISAPHSPATLAVRTVSDEGWNPNSQFRNPLRGRPAVSRVAFETSDVPTEEIPVNPLGATAKPFEGADVEAPNNPLR